MALGARDPAAFRLLASEIERGNISEHALPDATDRVREAADAFVKDQAREREETRLIRRLDRARWHFETRRRYGLRLALRDTFLWQRCENRFFTLLPDSDRLRRALDEVEGRPHRPSRRARA